jgi:Flp pilus assembly protein TadD
LGNLESSQGEYLKSTEYYRRALALRPSDTDVRTNLGITLLRLGHVQEAVDAFRQAIRDAPEHALAHYNLGVALVQAGEGTEAVAELQEAIRLAQEGKGTIPVADAAALIAEIQPPETTQQ